MRARSPILRSDTSGRNIPRENETLAYAPLGGEMIKRVAFFKSRKVVSPEKWFQTGQAATDHRVGNSGEEPVRVEVENRLFDDLALEVLRCVSRL